MQLAKIKNVGVLAPMREETAIFLQNLSFKKICSRPFTLYQCMLGGKKVYLIESGGGKVSAAAATQYLIDHYNIDCIISEGVAGSLKAKIRTGTLIIGQKVQQYDIDVSELGFKIGEIPFTGISELYASPPLIKKVRAMCRKEKIPFSQGKIISGDTFVTSNKVVSNLQKKFGAIGIEMESAAIAYTAHMNSIPWVVLRVISDGANKNASKDFESNLENAAKKAAIVIIKFIRFL